MRPTDLPPAPNSRSTVMTNTPLRGRPRQSASHWRQLPPHEGTVVSVEYQLAQPFGRDSGPAAAPQPDGNDHSVLSAPRHAWAPCRRDQPASDQRYQGIVPLEGDSLAKAAESFFAQSEQIPSIVRLSVQKGAGGWSARSRPSASSPSMHDTAAECVEWRCTIAPAPARSCGRTKMPLEFL